MLSIFYGLSSALTWGAADFCGGLASRRARPYQAVLLGEGVGMLLLLVIALFFHNETPLSLRGWLFCSLAGALGVSGLLLFFTSLANGQMSVAAPVSALTSTIIPVVFGSLLEGFPGPATFAGFLLALVAIWLISRHEGRALQFHLRLKDLLLPLIAGVCFGLYFVVIDQGSEGKLLLPLLATRSAGILTMLIYLLVGRRQVTPARTAWGFILLNGLLDIFGNGLYVLAAQVGRMDVAAVLGSLYPAPTVLFAWLLLRERINRPQFMGILAALAAIVLMTL